MNSPDQEVNTADSKKPVNQGNPINERVYQELSKELTKNLRSRVNTVIFGTFLYFLSFSELFRLNDLKPFIETTEDVIINSLIFLLGSSFMVYRYEKLRIKKKEIKSRMR